MRRLLALAAAAGIFGVAGCDFSQQKKDASKAVESPAVETPKEQRPAVPKAPPARPVLPHAMPRVVPLEFAAGEKSMEAGEIEAFEMTLLDDLISQTKNRPFWNAQGQTTRRAQTLWAIWIARSSGYRSNVISPAAKASDLLKLSEGMFTEVPATTLEATARLQMMTTISSMISPEKILTAEVRRDITTISNAFQPDDGLAPDAAAVGKAPSSIVQTSIAALALCSAVGRGYEIPANVSSRLDKFLRTAQLPDGSWREAGYSDEEATAIAAAALCRVAMLNDQVVRLEARPDKNLESALKYIDRNIKVMPVKGPHSVMAAYYLQQLRLSVGQDPMTPAQIIDIHWKTVRRPLALDELVEIFNFTLLAMEDALRPVMLQKLDFGGGNARPQDVANVSDWLGRKIEYPFRWRSVTFDTPSWDEAPILVITGSKVLNLTSEQIERLRTYVERGGLIFSSADGADAKFTNSISKLAVQVFGGKYEMRELPIDHMLFSSKNELWSPIKPPMKLLAISNGVRELWVHSTSDLGTAWQAKKFANIAAFDLVANLSRYVTGKTPVAPLWIKRDEVTLLPTTKWLTVGRAMYHGNWDAEPAAWKRMAIEARKSGIGLRTADVLIRNLRADEIPVAHLSLTNDIPVSSEDVEAIMRYVGDGGVLLIDAAGGGVSAVSALDAGADKIFPNAKWEISRQLERGDHRIFSRLKLGKNQLPQLEEIREGGKRRAVIFAGDLTAAMAGVKTWGVNGLNPEPARAAVMEIIKDAAK